LRRLGAAPRQLGAHAHDNQVGSGLYRLFQRVFERDPSTGDSARLLRAVVLMLLGLSIGTGSAAADTYLHRGIESGSETPYVLHSTGHELAINADLVEKLGQIDQIGEMLQKNGYRYVRQPFYWSTIEPQRGSFQWDTYDRIVSGLGAHGIEVIAVIEGTPAWARPPDKLGYTDAPPTSSGDYAAVVGEIVRRYKNSIQFVQIWDFPNQPDHWGGARATPADYLRLLAEAFNASRTANSETKVVLAELDPAYDGGTLGADLSFLHGLYAAGGSPFFDIVAARVDGGSASPFDRRVDASRENFSRAVLFRELLSEMNDTVKPIWLTHFGWSASDTGPIDAQEQADFDVAAAQRARAEWPWLGIMFSWGLFPGANGSAGAGQAMLTADGQPTLAFTALADYAKSGAARTASTGYVPMDSEPVAYSGNWDEQHLERQTFQTTAETGASATLQFRGTGVVAILRFSPQAGPIAIKIDGAPVSGWPVEQGASIVDLSSFQAADIPLVLARGLDDTDHVLSITLADKGQLTIGGLIVSRDPPLLWPVIVLVVIAIVTVAVGLRDVVYLVALHSRVLQRRNQAGMRPSLGHIPDWRQSSRW
jgi:hypothetical protein